MAPRGRHHWQADALRGGVAGLVGTWLMDLVTTGLLADQSEVSKRREEAARPNGRSSVANLVDRLEAALGVTLDDPQRRAATQAIHYGLGILPGAAYAVSRRRLPLIGVGRGFVFGLVLWALNDEYLNIKLGLAAPIEAYPVETHWRGLVGHVVLGMTTDACIDVLGG